MAVDGAQRTRGGRRDRARRPKPSSCPVRAATTWRWSAHFAPRPSTRSVPRMRSSRPTDQQEAMRLSAELKHRRLRRVLAHPRGSPRPGPRPTSRRGRAARRRRCDPRPHRLHADARRPAAQRRDVGGRPRRSRRARAQSSRPRDAHFPSIRRSRWPTGCSPRS